jgi:hypothetical protein
MEGKFVEDREDETGGQGVAEGASNMKAPLT